MSSRVQRRMFLPTKGNKAILAADKDFYDAALNQYNLAPGQIGFFDTKTNKSITSFADSPTFFIAIGVDKVASKTTSDGVRLAAGEEISQCRIDAATADPYKAGASNSAKFLFGCTDCGETYSIGIQIDDPNVNFFYPQNRYHVETITVQSENCPECDGDCNYSHSCSELATKFKDAILANEFLKGYVASVDVLTAAADLENFSCGIKVTFKGTGYECGCFPQAENILNKYTKGSIRTTIDSGWKKNSTKSTFDLSTMAIEKGHGAQLQWEEYLEEPGGIGFNGLNNTFETNGAPFYSQIGVSRSKNLLVDCNETYCQYSLAYHGSSKNEDANGSTWNPHFITTILVPMADVATQGALETALNEFLSAGPCKREVVLTCGDSTSHDNSTDETTVENIN